MIPSLDFSLEISRSYRFPAERLFRAWTTPKDVAAWWYAGDPAYRVEADMDVRVGGSYRISMWKPGQPAPLAVVGKYNNVEFPWLLGFSWRWEHHPAEKVTQVRVEFADQPGSGCHLTLRHKGFPDENMRDQHQAGWARALTGLDLLDAAE